MFVKGWRVVPTALIIAATAPVLTTSAGAVPPVSTSAIGTVAAWSAWESLGGKLGQRPVAASWGQDRLDVLVVGTDGSNWDDSYDLVNGWQWTSLNSQSSSELSPATNPALPHYLDVFERTPFGIDLSTGTYGNHLYVDTYHDAWGQLPGRTGNLAAEPSGLMWPNYDRVYVEGTDQQLWHWQYNFPVPCCAGGGWVGSVGGRLSSAPAAVRVINNTMNEDVVFVRGTDLALWYWSSISGWHAAGGKLGSKPNVVWVGNGSPDAFVQGTDGALWHFSATAGTWESIGGRIIGVPSAVGFDVFVEGTDHALWHASYDGTSWHWEDLGGFLTTPPSAVSWGSGRFDVFARGPNGDLLHRFYQ